MQRARPVLPYDKHSFITILQCLLNAVQIKKKCAIVVIDAVRVNMNSVT
jgi:hypothetical protein